MANSSNYLYTSYGVQSRKPITQLNEAEFNDLMNQNNLFKQRQNLLAGVGGQSNSSSSSSSSNYASNGSSSGNQTSSQFGGDWTQGNNNFGFDRMKTMAKELSQMQLDQAKQQMDLSYGYRDKEANRDYGFQRGLSEQNYQQQRGLSEQSYQQQRGINEQRNTFDVAMVQLRDNLRQQQTEGDRQAATRLYFGKARGNRRF